MFRITGFIVVNIVGFILMGIIIDELGGVAAELFTGESPLPFEQCKGGPIVWNSLDLCAKWVVRTASEQAGFADTAFQETQGERLPFDYPAFADVAKQEAMPGDELSHEDITVLFVSSAVAVRARTERPDLAQEEESRWRSYLELFRVAESHTMDPKGLYVHPRVPMQSRNLAVPALTVIAAQPGGEHDQGGAGLEPLRK